jgi:hypothetical protein
MALTLWKMKEVTDQMFQQAKLNKFSRFTIANQDNFLPEIFKLYYTNQNLKEITIG